MNRSKIKEIHDYLEADEINKMVRRIQKFGEVDFFLNTIFI